LLIYACISLQLLDPSVMEKEMSLKVSAKHLASVFVALAKAKYSSGKT